KQLQKLISMGDLDLAFLTLTDKDRSDDLYEPIYDEELFLVIPAGHPLAGTRPEDGEDYATMDIRRLEYEPFVLMDRRSTMSTMLNRIFAEAGFSPQVLFETGNNHTIISMIRANMCCGILPYYYVKDLDQDFCCFHLPSRPTWQFTASYKKGRYLSRPARSFIDLMKEQWGDKITATQ
uniref:LysR family transcriptional regulator substrate-binding protein n=2 Tax=Bacillota TaxID=1239 RepID=UPI00349EB7FB